MSHGNITRESATRRSLQVRAQGYQVLVDLSGRMMPAGEPTTHFVSVTTLRFASNAGPTHVDLIADQVIEASLNGEAIDTSGYDGYTLEFEAPEGDAELRVVGLCRYSNSGEGLHRFVDPADDRVYLYTQFEAADARRMYATLEQPDQKATFQLSVIAPAGWTVISNAPAVEPTDAGDGFARWDFAPTPPISTYITALIAGEFHVVRDTFASTSGEVPASILCRQSKVAHLDAERIFETTRRGFAVFEEHFGYPYPFGTYDQIFVPEFNAGAMENAGCVTIRDEYLYRSRVTAREYENRDNTILHELAHMWFGDLVTMTWWDDLWLNESFAEWASHFAQQEIVAQYGGVNPWASFANARKNWAYLQDQLPTTHPIAADMYDLEAVEQNFDGITYAKGASVLKLLVSFVGQDDYLAGVREYFAEHAFGNTQLSDLLGAVEKASGRDLSWFSGEWLQTSGVNTLRADFDVDDEGRFTRFDVVQTASEEHPTLRTHRLAIGVYTLEGDELRRTQRVELDVSGERTNVDDLVGHPRGDLILLNDGDLTYAKTRLDPVSLQTLISHLDALSDPLARSIAWGCAWDMLRDAELRSLDFVRLALSGLSTETDQTAISSVLGQCQLAATGYTAPALRGKVRGELVNGLVRALKSAEPASDTQLAYAKALVEAVFTPTGAELLKAWLEGEEVPEGLVLDTDLRWTILAALARMSEIGEDDIAAEAENDRTNQGAERAAGVAAALADPETKAEAWQLATDDPSVPNETHRAICGHFLQYEQDDLLEPYRGKYFELATAISKREGSWAKRGFAAVSTTLNLLFPLPTDETVSLAEGWLASDAPSEQARRTVSEKLDSARRALACQAASLADETTTPTNEESHD